MVTPLVLQAIPRTCCSTVETTLTTRWSLSLVSPSWAVWPVAKHLRIFISCPPSVLGSRSQMPSMYFISMTAESMPAGKSHGILPHDGRCDPTVRQSSLPVCRCRYGRRGATSMHQPGEFTDTIACKLHINQVVRAAFPLPNVLLAGAGRDAVHCLPPKTPLLLFVGWRRVCAGTFSFCVK